MKPVSELSDDELGALIRRARQELPSAPLAMQQAAIALWHSSTLASPSAHAARQVWNRIAAVLAFDSWSQPALQHGMRSVASPIRHLLYSARGCDVDLRITPHAEAFSLRGQVLGPDESGVVELSTQRPDSTGEHVVRVTHLNAMGEFRIDGVRQGRYQLTLRVGNDQIALPPFGVGEPEP